MTLSAATGWRGLVLSHCAAGSFLTSGDLWLDEDVDISPSSFSCNMPGESCICEGCTWLHVVKLGVGPWFSVTVPPCISPVFSLPLCRNEDAINQMAVPPFPTPPLPPVLSVKVTSHRHRNKLIQISALFVCAHKVTGSGPLRFSVCLQLLLLSPPQQTACHSARHQIWSVSTCCITYYNKQTAWLSQRNYGFVLAPECRDILVSSPVELLVLLFARYSCINKDLGLL